MNSLSVLPNEPNKTEPGRSSSSAPVLPWWQRLWPWLASIASGVMLAGCYGPWDKGALVWFALIPLICAVWFGPGKRPLLLGYVTGVIFFTATFYWLSALGTLFHSTALKGLPLLLALYLGLYPGLWAWFLARVAAPTPEERHFPNSWRNLATGAVAASAWTGLEWMRGWFLTGFGWNGLGVALHRELPMIQIAELTGVFGLTWLVAFINVMAVIIVRRIAGELGASFLKRIRWEFSVTMAVLIMVFGYGVRSLFKFDADKKQPAARKAVVAMVQPNIPQVEKFDPDFEDQTFEQLRTLTGLAAATGPQLIVWPEAATPRGFFADQTNFDFFQSLLAELPCPLLAGSVVETLVDDEPRTFNSAILFDRHAAAAKAVPQQHNKVHLVPFGEYLPLRPALGWLLSNLVPGDMDAGDSFRPMEHPQLGRIAPLICFEDTLGRVTRRYVSENPGQPPDVFINLTNDGWFLQTCAVDQHMANAIFRAVEHRRPLLRCANTGVTGIVQPTGMVDRGIKPHQPGVVTRAIELRPGPVTFYARFGDWVAAVSGIVILGAIVRRRIRSKA